MKYTNTMPIDASNYEKNAKTKLKIRRIYDLIPSNMKNKKKRLRANKIENKQAKLIEFRDEFDYLLSSGIAL